MDDDLEPKAKLPKVAKVIVAEGFSVLVVYRWPGVKCEHADLRIVEPVKCGQRCGQQSAFYPLTRNQLQASRVRQSVLFISLLDICMT